MTTEYQRRREAGLRAASPRGMDPARVKARRAEQTRRAMEARRRALIILADRHAAEFHDLYRAEMAGVVAERGPLPGDDFLMADNPYTRSATVTIVELVPTREMLPQCSAWLANLHRCSLRGRYLQNEHPVCGVHLGRPGLLFHPTARR